MPRDTPTPAPTATPTFDPWVGCGLKPHIVDVEVHSRVGLGIEENPGVVVVALGVRVVPTEVEADVEEEVRLLNSKSRRTI